MVHIIRCKFIAVFVVSWVKAQEYIENLHDSKYGTHFKEIPKSFEIKGIDPDGQFHKYNEQIQVVARQENLTVLYKIKIEIQKPLKYHPKKVTPKKGKSKKYNIPLKKTSMKLSNFEVWLRKMAEQSGVNNKGHSSNLEKHQVTTEGETVITTTKQIKLKFKPIISKIKTNYTKYVKPVRNRIITLTT